MPPQIMLTATEREKLGALVNNISIHAAQLITRTSSELFTRAVANLVKMKNEHEDLIKRVDELAREQNEESPLRLIEDLQRVPADVAQMLTVVRRCLSASAFLGHLLAQPSLSQPAGEPPERQTRLH